MLRITSPAFADEGPIPRAHTCDGADLSPPLVWMGLPADTVELALIMDDPDAPGGTFVHWVLYGLAPEGSSLPSGLGREPELRGQVTARQGMNGFGKVGYGGPCPPKGPAHHYVFSLYAVDARLDVPPGATDTIVRDAIRRHTLEEARLVGTYARA